jgi:putative sigma-54 modulation protein
MPEDPPVTITAEKGLRAVWGFGILGRYVSDFASGTQSARTAQQQQHKRIAMKRQNNRELIVSGIHLDLTPSLKVFVQEKTERLFRHEERILRLRIELECDSSAKFEARFKAKGHVIIEGPELTATVASDECHKAVSLLTDKLDRMLGRRAQLWRVKRHRPHPIDLGSALPKAI